MADIKSHYLYTVLAPEYFRLAVRLLTKELRKHKDEFDTIVIRGISGALIGPVVAYNLEKPLTVIRKEPSHTTRIMEGNYALKNYIIIDDFVESGSTLTTIVREVKEQASWYEYNVDNIKCVGVVLYNVGQEDMNVGGYQWGKVKKALGHDNFFGVGIYDKIQKLLNGAQV